MNDSECISSIVDEKKFNEFQSFGWNVDLIMDKYHPLWINIACSWMNYFLSWTMNQTKWKYFIYIICKNCKLCLIDLC